MNTSELISELEILYYNIDDDGDSKSRIFKLIANIAKNACIMPICRSNDDSHNEEN